VGVMNENDQLDEVSLAFGEHNQEVVMKSKMGLHETSGVSNSSWRNSKGYLKF
jgi:hypothetical protein